MAWWQRQERAVFVSEECFEWLLASGAVDALTDYVEAPACCLPAHDRETREVRPAKNDAREYPPARFTRGCELPRALQSLHQSQGSSVVHRLLVIAYCVLRDQRPYAELGADYFDQRDAARIEHHHVQRLQQLGYTVTLTPLGA